MSKGGGDKGGKGAAGFLPPEAMKFAKQMGIDLGGLEPEAREIWMQLNKLSMEDPLEYEKFVAEQLQLGKEEGEAGASGKDKKNRSFRPTEGFCVETTTFGGDGLKVRDVETNASKKLYLNMCSSNLIEDPRDKAGKVLDFSHHTADGLEIPLLIGPVRKVDEESNAIDVIFSPKVLECCQREKYFRQQIIELAADWVKQETKLQFNKRHCDVMSGSHYMGGLGDDKATPVLFHITEETMNGPPPPPPPSSSSSDPKAANVLGAGSAPQKGGTEDLLSSTKSLLSEISKDKNDTPEPMITEVLTSKKNEAKSAGKPIIQEVGAEKAELDSKPKDAKSVKFGDDNSKESKPTPPPAVEPVKPLKPPTKKDLDKFQSLFSDFDHELDSANASSWDEESTAGLLTDLAKALAVTPGELKPETLKNNLVSAISNQSNGHPNTDIARTVTDVAIDNPVDDIVKVTAVITKDSGEESLSISIEGLSSTADASALDLQASKTEVRIKCNLNSFVDGKGRNESKVITVRYLNPKQTLDSKKIKASLKKKQGKMLVSVGCGPLPK